MSVHYITAGEYMTLALERSASCFNSLDADFISRKIRTGLTQFIFCGSGSSLITEVPCQRSGETFGIFTIQADSPSTSLYVLEH